jgi:hypothetical protein
VTAAPATRLGIGYRRSVKSVGAFEQYGVDDSPERQKHDCMVWIDRNINGGTVVAEYEEDGYPAWEVKGVPRKKRPVFERQIRDIKAGRLDLMVYWKVDRGARGYTNGGRLWQACQATDTRLVFVNDGLDSEHPMFEQMYFWLLGMAKEYSNRISAGLKQYQEALRRAGVRPPVRRRFAWAPDGLTPLWADGELTWKVRRRPPEGGPPVLLEVTFDPEATYLREAGEQFLADRKHSLGRIVNDWNTRGIRTAYGLEWRVTTLIKAFRAPYNELIFGTELYDEIQTVLNDRRTGPRGSERVHLQTGRIFHDEPACGKRMNVVVGRHRKAAGSAAYTNCGSGDQRSGCGKGYIDASQCDGLLLDDLMYRLECRAVEKGLARASADGEHRDLGAEKQRADARYKELKEELAELEEAPDYATDRKKQARADGKTEAMARLKVKMDDIDHLIREQQDQLYDDQLVEGAIKLGPALRAEWPKKTAQERRDLLEAAGWERTNVRTGKRRSRTLDPWRVERHWRNKRDGELVVEVGPSKGALPPPTCAHPDGCPNPPRGRERRWPYRLHEWCVMHWQRIRRTGDPGPVGKLPARPLPKNPPPGWPSDAPHCTAPGCDRSRHGRMPWCFADWTYWRRTGKLPQPK